MEDLANTDKINQASQPTENTGATSNIPSKADIVHNYTS